MKLFKNSQFYLFILIILILGSCRKGPTTPYFEGETIDSSIQIGYGLAIGDVDGDQKPDIILADKKQFVWYRNPDWKRFVMIDSLTERDNVCIAARDVDGDGMVEIALGAQWNPGETSDRSTSGSVHYLIRPEDPTQLWTTVKLYHEPTIHRMKWIKTNDGNAYLTVLPLHGKGNVKGEGTTVNLLAYKFPQNPNQEWEQQIISTEMHMTHNYDIQPGDNGEYMIIGGREGIRSILYDGTSWELHPKPIVVNHSFGEVRMGYLKNGYPFIAGIEPIHGNILSVNSPEDTTLRKILIKDLNQGHALACADFLERGEDQIVVGWRNQNEEQKVGIRMYLQGEYGKWEQYLIDDNGVACEDLKVADLDNDGKLDIIAAGRSSKNVKIYWNRSGEKSSMP